MIKQLAFTVLLTLISPNVVVAQEQTATAFWVYRSANIRSEPTTAGGSTTVIRAARRGEQLSIVGEVTGEIPAGWSDNNVWYVVELDGGETGYVYSALVAAEPPLPQSNTGEAHNEPAINGPENFRNRVRGALNLLRDRYPEMYEFVNRWTREIVSHYRCGSAAVYERKIRIGGDTCFYLNDATWASILVHESCHVMQYMTGHRYIGVDAERACFEMELDTLRTIDPGNPYLPQKEHVLRNISNPICQWWRRVGYNRSLCLALP